jgi:hypothetical protein
VPALLLEGDGGGGVPTLLLEGDGDELHDDDKGGGGWRARAGERPWQRRTRATTPVAKKSGGARASNDNGSRWGSYWNLLGLGNANMVGRTRRATHFSDPQRIAVGHRLTTSNVKIWTPRDCHSGSLVAVEVS